MEYSIDRLKKQASARIKIIIDEYCDGIQQLLADTTGVAKASISQYAHGRNVPNNITAKKLGTPFGINPAWIMGFDVPMKIQTSGFELSEDEAVIISKYRALDQQTKKHLLKYIEFIVDQKNN